jgi:putative membrane protein
MEYYDILKSLHVVSIIAWMAGLLYLPRLFVYHANVVAGNEPSETFKIMERRLLKAIMNPAMIASWIFGLWMVWLAEWWTEPWMHVKFLGVIGLTVVHHMLAKDVKRFAADENVKTHTYFRILNEVPTVLMIIIVFMVIMKPFS